MAGGDHLGAGKAGLTQQAIQGQLSQIRQEQIEAAELGPKPAGAQVQFPDIGHRCRGRSCPGGSLLVASPWQPGKALLFEQYADHGRADGVPFGAQGLGDVVDGEVLFPQLNDLLAGAVLLRGLFGSLGGWEEEGPVRILAKLMTQNAEAGRGIAEAGRCLCRGQLVNEVGPERFVLPMGNVAGLQEEGCEISYLFFVLLNILPICHIWAFLVKKKVADRHEIVTESHKY